MLWKNNHDAKLWLLNTKPSIKSENLLTEDWSERLDKIHTLGLPFLACFQSKLVEFLVIFPSYSSAVYKYVAYAFRRPFVVSCKFKLCYVTRFVQHMRPWPWGCSWLTRRMKARSMTGQKEAGKVTNYISVPILKGYYFRGPVSQFSLATGLWTSGWRPLRTLEFVPFPNHTIPCLFSVQNIWGIFENKWNLFKMLKSGNCFLFQHKNVILARN